MSERPTDDIGRLVALSERFAEEGEMNLSKLLDAALYAQARHSGWSYRAPVTRATMVQELETSVQHLKASGADAGLIAALESGLAKLVRQDHRDMLVDEAPDVFVCRTCGHVSLGQPPDHCPDCGSWPGRFRKFVPMFNGDSAEPSNPMTVLVLLTKNAADLERLVGDLSEDVSARRPSAVVWSIREHVAHFYDTQEMLDTRVDLMLGHDDPDLAALSVFEFASQEDLHPTTAEATLAAFRVKRAACVARLEALPLRDLWRTGRHAEFGQITILRQASYLAYHEQTHLPEIEQLRQKVSGGRQDGPGPAEHLGWHQA